MSCVAQVSQAVLQMLILLAIAILTGISLAATGVAASEFAAVGEMAPPVSEILAR